MMTRHDVTSRRQKPLLLHLNQLVNVMFYENCSDLFQRVFRLKVQNYHSLHDVVTS